MTTAEGQLRPLKKGQDACPGGARPPSEAMIAFINDHREAYGPICKMLPIAPSTYHDHVAKRLTSKASVSFLNETLV
jgi:hypothetical protein